MFKNKEKTNKGLPKMSRSRRSQGTTSNCYIRHTFHVQRQILSATYCRSYKLSIGAYLGRYFHDISRIKINEKIKKKWLAIV